MHDTPNKYNNKILLLLLCAIIIYRKRIVHRLCRPTKQFTLSSSTGNMFVLAILDDMIRTLPDQFDRKSSDVLIEQIEMKYSNKVLPEVGLAITFYDFVSLADPYVYPAEGNFAPHSNVLSNLFNFIFY